MNICTKRVTNQSKLNCSWKEIVILGMNMFISYFAIYSIPSYAPRLVHKLGVPWRDVANHVGVLGNILLVTGSFGTFVAGAATSKFSPKKCVVVVNIFQGIACLAFGFSSTITFAYSTIAFVGGFTIIVGIRILVYKLCDKENQALVLTWATSVPMTLSSAFGPIIGGYLILPSEKYPNIFSPTGIFARYPGLLLQLLTGSASLLLGIATHLVIDEKHEYGRTVAESSTLLTSGSDLYDTDSTDDTLVTRESIWTIIKDDILTNQSSIGACLCYCSCGGVIVVYDVLLALWLEMPNKMFGRDYDTSDVGNLYMISGCLAVGVTHVCINKIIESLSTKVCYSIWLTVASFMIALTPTLLYIKNDNAFFTCLVLVNTIVMSCACGGFTAVHSFVQNSTTPRAAPFIFALSTIMAKLAEGLGAVCFSTLHNWSIKHHVFPLDYRFSFYCLSILVLFIYCFVLLIKDRQTSSATI